MADYLTVAEVYSRQHLLIDAIEEEAAALLNYKLESLANHHGFLDGNQRIAVSASACRPAYSASRNTPAATKTAASHR